MLRPSYSELMQVLNNDPDLDNKITSRYAVVIAASKRARQLIDGAIPQATGETNKAVSIAVIEMRDGLIKIVPNAGDLEDQNTSTMGTKESMEYFDVENNYGTDNFDDDIESFEDEN